MNLDSDSYTHEKHASPIIHTAPWLNQTATVSRWDWISQRSSLYPTSDAKGQEQIWPQKQIAGGMSSLGTIAIYLLDSK